MLTRSKLLFAALAAAAMMLTLVANASARSFQFSEQEFEILFRALSVQTSSNTITCPITLLGRFVERTIPKIIGTQIGAIRHALPLNGAEPPCTGGAITILNATLPWLILYEGFQGRLPAITRIRLSLVGVSFRVRTSNGIGCLAGTTPRNPAFFELLVNSEVGANRGLVEGINADPNAGIPLGGGFLCSLAGQVTFSGTGTVLNLPGTRLLRVFLI